MQIERRDAGSTTAFHSHGAGGRAAVAWRRSYTTPQRWELYAAHCDIVGDRGCSQAVLLANSTLGFSEPALGVDPNGNAIAAGKVDEPGSLENLWARRYVAATEQWGTPTLIESDNSVSAPNHKVGSPDRTSMAWVAAAARRWTDGDYPFFRNPGSRPRPGPASAAPGWCAEVVREDLRANRVGRSAVHALDEVRG